MTAQVSNVPDQANPANIPQFNWRQLAAFLLLPVAWWFILLYGITPLLLPAFSTSDGELNGFAVSSIATLGYLFEFLLALRIFRKEGYALRLRALKERIHWRWPRGWKAWAIILVLFVAGFGLSQLLQPSKQAIGSVLPPPDWFPAFKHPLKEASSLQDNFPGVVFEGNVLFLMLALFMGTMNIVGEELYYRGALIPKLHGLFGKWAWLVGGVLLMSNTPSVTLSFDLTRKSSQHHHRQLLHRRPEITPLPFCSEVDHSIGACPGAPFAGNGDSWSPPSRRRASDPISPAQSTVALCAINVKEAPIGVPLVSSSYIPTTDTRAISPMRSLSHHRRSPIQAGDWRRAGSARHIVAGFTEHSSPHPDTASHRKQLPRPAGSSVGLLLQPGKQRLEVTRNCSPHKRCTLVSAGGHQPPRSDPFHIPLDVVCGRPRLCEALQRRWRPFKSPFWLILGRSATYKNELYEVT